MPLSGVLPARCAAVVGTSSEPGCGAARQKERGITVKRLVIMSVAAALTLLGGVGGGLGLAVVTAGATGAATATSPSIVTSPPDWATLEQQALGAVSSYQDVGPLSAIGPMSSSTSSSFTLADGRQVPVQQRNVVTSDGQALDLVLLGGAQLVVTAASATGGSTMVLQPGSSTVAGAYPLVAAAGTGGGSGAALGTAAGGPSALLTSTPGNCYAAPGAPGVVGSVFGPLVMGVGEVVCYSSNENISILASIDENGTQVSGTAGGSGYTSFLQVAVYSGCTPISWTNAFQTAQLWSINGVLEGGAVSAASYLGCQ